MLLFSACVQQPKSKNHTYYNSNPFSMNHFLFFLFLTGLKHDQLCYYADTSMIPAPLLHYSNKGFKVSAFWN